MVQPGCIHSQIPISVRQDASSPSLAPSHKHRAHTYQKVSALRKRGVRSDTPIARQVVPAPLDEAGVAATAKVDAAKNERAMAAQARTPHDRLSHRRHPPDSRSSDGDRKRTPASSSSGRRGTKPQNESR